MSEERSSEKMTDSVIEALSGVPTETTQSADTLDLLMGGIPRYSCADQSSTDEVSFDIGQPPKSCNTEAGSPEFESSEMCHCDGPDDDLVCIPDGTSRNQVPSNGQVGTCHLKVERVISPSMQVGLEGNPLMGNTFTPVKIIGKANRRHDGRRIEATDSAAPAAVDGQAVGMSQSGEDQSSAQSSCSMPDLTMIANFCIAESQDADDDCEVVHVNSSEIEDQSISTCFAPPATSTQYPNGNPVTSPRESADPPDDCCQTIESDAPLEVMDSPTKPIKTAVFLIRRQPCNRLNFRLKRAAATPAPNIVAANIVDEDSSQPVASSASTVMPEGMRVLSTHDSPNERSQNVESSQAGFSQPPSNSPLLEEPSRTDPRAASADYILGLSDHEFYLLIDPLSQYMNDS